MLVYSSHRHDIVLGDALCQILQRGILRTQLVRDGHGREIEEQHQQALVVILDFPRRSGKGNGRGRSLRQLRVDRSCSSSGGGSGSIVRVCGSKTSTFCFWPSSVTAEIGRPSAR